MNVMPKMARYLSVFFAASWLLGLSVCAAQGDKYDEAIMQARRGMINELMDSIESSTSESTTASNAELSNTEITEKSKTTHITTTTTTTQTAPVDTLSEKVTESTTGREVTIPVTAKMESPDADVTTVHFKETVTQTVTQVVARSIEPPEMVEAPPIIVEGHLPEKKKDNLKTDNTIIRGEIRASVGFFSPDGGAVFTRANADLNEKNYRLLSSAALDRRRNTYDPGLFSRVKVVMDTLLIPPVNMHINVTADPWSWTGKSKVLTVTGVGGDRVNVQYLYWRNTNYTVNHILHTFINGDGIALPEIKLRKGNTVPATTVGSTFGNIFNIPETKVDFTFQPVREFWFDVKPNERTSMRFFPIAYDDQALSTDDPMRLSNNKTWWEESPWLRGWVQGGYNSGPGDFSKGSWDRSFSFFTRDSDGRYLTALRGASMDWEPDHDTSLKATIASPKTLWEEYGQATALPGSVRLKHYFGDYFYAGVTGNMHQGFALGNLDAENYVGSFDLGFAPLEWLKITGQYSASRSWYDKTASDYETKLAGNAFYGEIQMTSNAGVEPGAILRKDYFTFAPRGPLENFYVSRLFFGRMDENFESTLSNYKETRDDAFWSRHLTFYPSTYRYLPGQRPGASDAGLRSFALGNGLDSDRRVIGWRGDMTIYNGRIDVTGDFRRVTQAANDAVIENVGRLQVTYQPIDPLTTKMLLIYNSMPKTTAGIDPYVINSETGEHMVNINVDDAKDPSLGTAALGAKYQLTHWAAINGVWEYSNDSQTLGEDNFSRGVLNDSSFTTYIQNGKVYRKPIPFLYSQGFFDQPPYAYHNLFKAGLQFTPMEIWHIYLDWTRNPNQFAGNVDDNMNHYGIETSIIPNKRIGFFARYTYSQWNDLDRLVFDNVVDYKGFHNFFFEARMMLKDDSLLSIQYGVGPTYNVQQTSSTNPTISDYTSPVLETQHVVRVVLQKKF